MRHQATCIYQTLLPLEEDNFRRRLMPYLTIVGIRIALLQGHTSYHHFIHFQQSNFQRSIWHLHYFLQSIHLLCKVQLDLRWQLHNLQWRMSNHHYHRQLHHFGWSRMEVELLYRRIFLGKVFKLLTKHLLKSIRIQPCWFILICFWLIQHHLKVQQKLTSI